MSMKNVLQNDPSKPSILRARSKNTSALNSSENSLHRTSLSAKSTLHKTNIKTYSSAILSTKAKPISKHISSKMKSKSISSLTLLNKHKSTTLNKKKLDSLLSELLNKTSSSKTKKILKKNLSVSLQSSSLYASQTSSSSSCISSSIISASLPKNTFSAINNFGVSSKTNYNATSIALPLPKHASASKSHDLIANSTSNNLPNTNRNVHILPHSLTNDPNYSSLISINRPNYSSGANSDDMYTINPHCSSEDTMLRNCPIIDIDADDKFDEMMVCDYVKDIMSYLQSIEHLTCPDSNYLARQAEITPSMRQNLVNWIASIHHSLLMLPETFFLAINIIDRFLEKRFVSQNKIQLVGVIALYIASKYEEITTPTLAEYLKFVQLPNVASQFCNAERFMLRVLDYDMSFPGPLSFLRRISKADNYNLANRTLAKYILEATLLDNNFLIYKPSLIAASALYLARKIAGLDSWDDLFVIASGGYTSASLQTCTKQIILFLANKLNISSFAFKKFNTTSNNFSSSLAHNWAINYITKI
ncbi:hypothetical protein BB561_001265 [Smittium simulii]|uniref:Uncharacterized protein n=1 Tax=Smittium simulii TaxID=133385 RepID=A0A2T9YVC6_9FUNG|nr:hypothetical protein BB561_001265 [Smittium simulii]